MLLMTVVCLWLGWRAYLERQQTEALNWLRGLGGHVQCVGVQSVGVPTAGINNFVVRDAPITGANVTDINFLGLKSSDAEIDEIVRCASQLPKLQRVTFTDTAITYDGEQKLHAALPSLEVKVITSIFGREPTSLEMVNPR